MVCWGDNWVNQCGAPEETDDAVAISAGSTQSLILKADGTLRCSGGGEGGTGHAIFPLILAMLPLFQWALALALLAKSDGTVACWGKNDLRRVQCTAGAAQCGCRCLEGINDSSALKENGSVVAWGGRRVQPGATPDGAAGTW